MTQTAVIQTAVRGSQTTTPVILSGVRTSRSGVLAQSKDPYSLVPSYDCLRAFFPCSGLQR